MTNYPKRSERTRKIKFYRSKFKFLFIANLWLIYFIFLSLNYVTTSNTYSYFSDEEKIENTFTAAENFCEDNNYKKDHKDICKDNAGIGNGSENIDHKKYDTGDEDNPGHQGQYCDDPATSEIEVCDDQNNGNGNLKDTSSSSGTGTSP